MPSNFYCLDGYDRVKKYPLWLKSECMPDQHLLYPCCIPDAELVRVFSSMLQEGKVKLVKSAITLKYAIDDEKIYAYLLVFNLLSLYMYKCTCMQKRIPSVRSIL